MWCAPKLDAPHAIPRRPLRVSGTIQSRARRPPAPPPPLPPPPPPPGEPSSAPHRSILWYMAGRPPRGNRRGRQSLGRGEGRGRRGTAGGSGWAAGWPPHRVRAPILSLVRTVFSGSWSPPCLAPQRIRNIAEVNAADGGLSEKAAPGKSKHGAGGCSQISGAPGSREILPKSFGRECVPGGGERGNGLKLLPEGPHFYMTAIHRESTR